MGNQIGGVVWCSSGIIFSSYFDGGLCLGQVKYVLFSLIMSNLEAGNHHHQVIQVEPLEVWHHRELIIGPRFFGVATCTSYTHYICVPSQDGLFALILWYVQACPMKTEHFSSQVVPTFLDRFRS